MKKTGILLSILFIATFTIAQTKVVYNAYKPGLSMRDKPGAQASVLTKIPYGEKVTLVNPFNDTTTVVNEGMKGYWNLVEYKGRQGYVAGIYLLDIAPPKATVKTMADYFKQISTPAGAAVTSVTGNKDSEMYSSLKKQLYKNGCEYHEASFYESGYNTYFIPELTLQQGFILTRLIPEFKDVFSATDPYPSANKKIKMTGLGEGEKEIRIYADEGANWINKITVGFEQGAIYEYEIFELHGQLVISFGGGV